MALVMTPSCGARTYNELSSLANANSEFTERDTLFTKAATLLAKYEHKWGVCLVHRHCSLEDGEIMLATNNITEPTIPEDASIAYPERWLSTDQAYEFTTRVTEQPPATLFEEFRAIAGGMASVLGLYHIQPEEAGTWQVERTEGRRNVVETVSLQPAPSDTMLEAAWNFADGASRPSYCGQYCAIDWADATSHLGTHHVNG